MKPSPYLDASEATRSSPPRSSQMAAQAFGVKVRTSSVRCLGMLNPFARPGAFVSGGHVEADPDRGCLGGGLGAAEAGF
jgi:hypothetical protein